MRYSEWTHGHLTELYHSRSQNQGIKNMRSSRGDSIVIKVKAGWRLKLVVTPLPQLTPELPCK